MTSAKTSRGELGAMSIAEGAYFMFSSCFCGVLQMGARDGGDGVWWLFWRWGRGGEVGGAGGRAAWVAVVVHSALRLTCRT